MRDGVAFGIAVANCWPEAPHRAPLAQSRSSRSGTDRYAEAHIPVTTRLSPSFHLLTCLRVAAFKSTPLSREPLGAREYTYQFLACITCIKMSQKMEDTRSIQAYNGASGSPFNVQTFNVQLRSRGYADSELHMSRAVNRRIEG